MSKNVILIIFSIVFDLFFLSGCDSYKQHRTKKAIPETKETNATGLLKLDIDVKNFSILGNYIEEHDGYPG